MYRMLTQVQAERLAQEGQTTTDNILKEHYQMYLLDVLFKSTLGDKLVFKGGTALKLAYSSFRFSEDLDFSWTEKVEFALFADLIAKIPVIFAEAKVKDVSNKRNTYFARVSFEVEYKPIPIGIKVEINKEIKDLGYQVMVMKSVFNNLLVTGNVLTAEAIYQDKLNLLKVRREPRDLFDVWFLSQILGKKWMIKGRDKYTGREIQDRLNPFIPQNHKKVLTLFGK